MGLILTIAIAVAEIIKENLDKNTGDKIWKFLTKH